MNSTHLMRSGLIATFYILLMFTRAEAVETQSVQVPGKEGRPLSATLYTPDGGAPAPGVIVLHTAYGETEPADKAYAKRLVEAGFVALAVDYLHPSIKTKNQLWSPAITTDLVGVAKWLKSQPQVGGMEIGVVGFSLGAHGLMLASKFQGIRASVIYYGAYAPRKLPHGPKRLPGHLPVPISVAADVNGAVLLLHGEADDEVPVAQAQAMKAALESHGKTVELVTYPGAYHRFDRGDSNGAASGKGPKGTTYKLNTQARDDAWRRTIDWLGEHLN